jgi:tetratricopeptide (TPR) repeat protein
MTRQRPSGLTSLVWALAALVNACGQPDNAPAPGLDAQRAQVTPANTAVQPLPLPDLSPLSAPVQEQVRARHAVLEEAVARRATREELGRACGDLGLVLMAAGYDSAAERRLLNAQELVPSDPRWPYYLGQLYRTAGERAKASAMFERALELRPADLPTLVRLAETYLDQNEPQAAQRLFSQALTLQQDSSAALAGLGRAVLAQGHPAEAAAYLQRALASDPQATSLHYPLALAYRRLGELDKAEAHLRQRGSGAPTLVDPLMREYSWLLESGEAYHTRGVHALDAGEFEKGAALFRRGLELEPKNAPLGHALATTFYRMGRIDAAVEQFEEVLRWSPEYADTHFSLGVILGEQGRHREALGRFAAAVRYRPDYVDAHVGLAESFQISGRLEESLSHWRRVVELSPGFVEAWLEGAKVLVRLQRYQEAHSWLAAAKKVDPRRQEVVSLYESVDAMQRTRGSRP